MISPFLLCAVVLSVLLPAAHPQFKVVVFDPLNRFEIVTEFGFSWDVKDVIVKDAPNQEDAFGRSHSSHQTA